MDELMADQIATFINKSGGIEKMRTLRDIIREVNRQNTHCDLLARLAASDPSGAKQLLACAWVGIALSLEIYSNSETRH